MVTTNEEATLAEDITKCSLNETDVISGDCNKAQENIDGNQQATKETNRQNNNTSEEKEDIVEIDSQDEKSKEDFEVVDDGESHNEQINQEQSLDNQSLVHSEDDIIDYNDHDNVDDQGDGNDDDHHGNSDDDDSDDEDGWITPENINQVKADYGISETQCKPTNIAVGCLTTDFALQVITDYALAKVKFDFFPKTEKWSRGGKVLDICISSKNIRNLKLDPKRFFVSKPFHITL